MLQVEKEMPLIQFKLVLFSHLLKWMHLYTFKMTLRQSQFHGSTPVTMEATPSPDFPSSWKPITNKLTLKSSEASPTLLKWPTSCPVSPTNSKLLPSTPKDSASIHQLHLLSTQLYNHLNPSSSLCSVDLRVKFRSSGLRLLLQEGCPWLGTECIGLITIRCILKLLQLLWPTRSSWVIRIRL